MQLGESCSLQPFSLHKLLSYRSVLGHLMKSKCLFAQTFMLFLSFGEVVSVFLLFLYGQSKCCAAAQLHTRDCTSAPPLTVFFRLFNSAFRASERWWAEPLKHDYLGAGTR